MVNFMSEPALHSAVLRKRARTSRTLRAVFAFIIVALFGLGYVSEITGSGTGLFNISTVIGLSAISLLLIALLFTWSQVIVYSNGIELRWFPLYRKFLSFDEIGEVKVVALPAIRFGVGLRFYGGGDMGLIGRGGYGVYVPLTKVGGYYVSVGDEEDASAVAQAISALSNVTAPSRAIHTDKEPTT